MAKRLLPPPREERPPIPDFVPVPRRYRHDGWTPERQKAFIEALADTGCVDRAARMVNIAQTNAYRLRREPGAEGFRRAWDAALDFGLKRLKDIAFERAIEGQLVPVFVGGKLMGFRRKRNDALLMFCLRHYGQDKEGRRVTVNYFSSRASAGAVAGVADGPADGAGSEGPASLSAQGGAIAEASTTTVQTVITGGGDGQAALSEEAAAAAVQGFEGVRLDPQAEAEIQAALEACAARTRAAIAARDGGGMLAADADEDDPAEPFVAAGPNGVDYRGELLPPVTVEDFVPFRPGERHWSDAGAEVVDWVPVAATQERIGESGPAEDAPQENAPPSKGEKAGRVGRRGRVSRARRAAGEQPAAAAGQGADDAPADGAPPPPR